MKLKKYLERNDITVYAFADMLDVTPMAVYLWLSGKRIPRNNRLPQRIAAITGGKVTLVDFLED